MFLPVLFALVASGCRSPEPEIERDWNDPLALRLDELRQRTDDKSVVVIIDQAERQLDLHPRQQRRRIRRQDHDHHHRRHGHFYVGGNFGFTDGNESAGELQNDLNRRTPAGRSVVVDLDDTDIGYKAFLGYRFAQPFAFELGYAGLEGPDSTIRTPTLDGSLIGDIQDLHPITGRGPTLSLVGYPIRCGRFEMFGRIGVWYWEADVKVNVGSTVVRKDPNGWDPIVGVGAQYRLFDEVRARVEYERYFLRDWDIDMLSVGLTVGF